MRSNVAIAGAPTALALLPGEDHFATVAKIAQPTLDAIVELRKALNWLDRKRQSAKLFDPADVEDLLSLIPTEDRLRQIKRLFREAEHEPALESWVNLTIGVMLQSIPEAADVPDAYRLGIVDSAFRDPDISGAYDPGFSSSVIVRAIRECRRHQGVPSSGRFLELCSKLRRWFKLRCKDIDELIALRDEAEKAPLVPAISEDDVVDPDDPNYIPIE
jgi:hypothetical protein